MGMDTFKDGVAEFELFSIEVWLTTQAMKERR